MTFKKLTAEELAAYHPQAGARPEYVAALQQLKTGEGGIATVAEEGITRQAIKNRLNRAASAIGIELKYLRAGSDTVAFQVVGAVAGAKPRRSRRPKAE